MYITNVVGLTKFQYTYTIEILMEVRSRYEQSKGEQVKKLNPVIIMKSVIILKI